MIRINVFGADPEDIRAEGDADYEGNDDGKAIANDIHQLLQEDYGYLEIEGVSVDVSDVSVENAPDFPEDER